MLEPSFAMVLGLILGLAMLAKASAILLFLLLTGFCLVRGLQESAQGPGRSNLRPMGRFLAQCWTPAALVAGWYYLRNWWWLGRPFVGGWDGNRGFTWWQDPGYVSFSTLVSFGTALVHPIYAQTAGFWNGLYSTLWLDGSLSGIALMDYRPPWNYGFLMACALLALIPCSIMVWGAVKAFRRPPVALSLACLAAYVAAIFHLHVTQLPVYSTLKATYLLGLIPCLCILAGAGLQALPERPWLKAFVHGAFACFIVTAFLGYFAV
jgi:hypothetical protein